MRGLWLLRLAAPAAVVAALLVDAGVGPASGVDVVVEPVAEIAVPSARTLTSTWFCPLVHMSVVDDRRLEIESEIVVVNTTGATVRATIDLRSTRERRSHSLSIGPHATVSVRTLDIAAEPGELTSAVVEAASGGVAVTRRLWSPLGADEARCSSAAATEWFVPLGDTQSDAIDIVVIGNPLHRDAIVDVEFASEVESGALPVPDLNGIVVPGNSSTLIDLDEVASRRSLLSATVRARTGRVVVDHVAAYDGTTGRAGLSVELASPADGGEWWLPLAGVDEATRTWVRVLNATDEVAEVELKAVGAAAPAGEAPVESTALVAVAPNDVIEVEVLSDDVALPPLLALLVPRGGPAGLSVRSLNGVPVAVAVEVLTGVAAGPMEDGAAEADAAEDGPVGASAVGAGTGGEAEAEARQTAPPSPPQPPVFDVESGLTGLPAHPAARTRWLVVVPDGEGAEAQVVVMTVPATAPADGAEPAPAGVVRVGSLDGGSLGVIRVPSSGVASYPVSGGATLVLESDVAFVVAAYQITPLAIDPAHPRIPLVPAGIGGIVAVPY